MGHFWGTPPAAYSTPREVVIRRQVNCREGRLFDHFVRGYEQARGHCQAESLRCLEVHGRLVLCRGLHRKNGRLVAAEDAVDLRRGQSKRIDLVDSVGHEATSRDEVAGRIDRR